MHNLFDFASLPRGSHDFTSISYCPNRGFEPWVPIAKKTIRAVGGYRGYGAGRIVRPRMPRRLATALDYRASVPPVISWRK
jgi:hypothetical protein